MNNLNNNRGFTLIELLAVIVILAIVMVLASSSILPFMRNAGRDAFVLEANGAIDAASNAISLITIGSIGLDGSYGSNTAPDAADYKRDVSKNEYCFSIKYLVDNGLFDLDESSLYDAEHNKNGYRGVVKASKSGNSYSYTVYLINDEFYVKDEENTVKEDEVKSYSSSLPSGFITTCN